MCGRKIKIGAFAVSWWIRGRRGRKAGAGSAGGRGWVGAESTRPWWLPVAELSRTHHALRLGFAPPPAPGPLRAFALQAGRLTWRTVAYAGQYIVPAFVFTLLAAATIRTWRAPAPLLLRYARNSHGVVGYAGGAADAASGRPVVRPRRALLVVIVLAGLLLRLPWLAAPGYNGMGVWKAWAYGTGRLGLAGIYRLRQTPEPPLTPRTISLALSGALPLVKVGFPQRAFPPDYPPGTFYLLWLLARGYQHLGAPDWRDGPALNLSIKLPLLLAELAAALLLGWAVARRRPGRAYLGVVAGYWLNPAVLLGGSILGYLDALYALFLTGGAVALLQGRPRGLWIGWALALALKPQPVLVLPALGVLSRRAGAGRLARDAAMVGGILLAASLPVLRGGHPLGLIAGLAANSHEGYVSANQFNLWWLWSYGYARSHGEPQAHMLAQAQLTSQGIGDLQPWGLALFAGWTLFLAAAWIRQHRRVPGPPPVSAASILLLALQFYGAVLLLTSMHENHLLGALPLFALAAGVGGGSLPARPTRLLWEIYGAVSAITAANLLIVYGLGEGGAHPLARWWGAVDGSLVLASLNLLLLALCAGLWARGIFVLPAGEAVHNGG